MLSERQRNIIVELTLVGRTAQYIADRFDCWISTIRRISKRYRETGRWQSLPGRGRPKKATARDGRYLGRLVKRIRFYSLSRVKQEFVTHLGHPVSKLSREGSMVRQLTAVLLHKNRTLVSRTGSDAGDGVPEPLAGQYHTTGPAHLFPMNQGSTLHIASGGLGYGEQQGRNICPNVYAWSVEIESFLWRCEGHWLPRCWQSGHSRWNVNAEKYVRTLSEKLLGCVENLFGDINHQFVFQHDSAAAHTARRTVAWLELYDISTIQWPSQSPDLDMIEQVWEFMGREIVRVMSVMKIWCKLCTIPGWTPRCHICTIYTTPFPDE